MMEAEDNLPCFIGQLPDELLQQIFVCCAEVDGKSFDHIGIVQLPSPLVAPLLLMLVCLKWREVAHDTPHLWHRILIPMRRDPTTVPEIVPFVNALQKWLRRSKNLPLTIRIQDRSSHFEEPESDLSECNYSSDDFDYEGYHHRVENRVNVAWEEIFPVIHDHFSRFSRISVDKDLAPLLFPPYTSQQTPALKELVLTDQSGGLLDHSDDPLHIIGTVKRVRHLVLDTYIDGFFRRRHRVFKKLKCLSLMHPPNTDEIIKVLGRCSSLLFLRLGDSWTYHSSMPDIFRHDALTILIAGSESQGTSMDNLFDRLELPGLHTMVLLHPEPLVKTCSSVIAMLKRSSCTLGLFKVIDTPGLVIPEESLRELLTVAEMVQVNFEKPYSRSQAQDLDDHPLDKQ
ncbi:hypothetical protein HYDPIDRAFT_28088 [Hydnomerulius pinastri MD-312]|uniref:F-box domain-containing protein n=1 Tax=Hydnomerulius pinastri MD-312 TaxID=994086 RepID=A0A0C9WFE0_9AGAM|nr:hypothetical protein HYDPIDRAFT_28088 [Hydnomerulius pinastri MD-312]